MTSSLPLPPTLDSLEGVPGRVGSLEELAGGRDLLVLVASSERTMSDRLRQTLIGLQEVVSQHSVQVAAVTMVGAATYRKLARKTSVSYPLLSDPSRAWLDLLGRGAPPVGGGVVLYVVAVPPGAVLAQFGEEGGVPQLLEAVGAAVGRGRAALEAEAATRAQEASKAAEVRWEAWTPGALTCALPWQPHAPPLLAPVPSSACGRRAQVAALQAENERLRRELAATAGARIAEERAATCVDTDAPGLCTACTRYVYQPRLPELARACPDAPRTLRRTEYAYRPRACRSFGGASLRLMGKDLNRNERTVCAPQVAARAERRRTAAAEAAAVNARQAARQEAVVAD